MIGTQIRAARELLGLSQTAFSEATDVSIPTLHDIEMGKGNPSSVKVDQVLNYLKGRGIVFSDEEGRIGLPPRDIEPTTHLQDHLDEALVAMKTAIEAAEVVSTALAKAKQETKELEERIKRRDRRIKKNVSKTRGK